MTGLDSLYLTDEQIAERVGVGVEKWRANARVLEREGLPARDPLFCDRRYWPAIRAFLDRRAGLDAPSIIVPDGQEDWSHVKRTRAKAPTSQ